MAINVFTTTSLIELPRIRSDRGNLTFLESNISVPFEIKRVFYLYDVPGGGTRGGHAHYALHEIIIAASGSFEVIVDNGIETTTYSLNRSYQGLHVPPMTWRQLVNFSTGSICLVLASELYSEDDYIRNYEAFQQISRGDGHEYPLS